MLPKGKLVIIGGAVDLGSSLSYNENISHPHYIKFFERGILKRMITESSKGEDSVVEVITTASKIPEIVGAEYIKSFNQLQVGNVNVLDIRSRDVASSPEVKERIKNADVVMFSGGDQLRLSAIFGGTELLKILKERYQNESFIIAGTSAGAAAASTNMIYRGNSSEALIKGEVQITGGLGFIDDVIIDTHFVQRGRMGRLFYAVASNPGMLGIGLGEDAGLLIKGNTMEAIGSGLTILVDGRYINETSIYDVEIGSPVSIDNLRVHVMSIFDKYDLHRHQLFINQAIRVEEDVYLKAKDKD
ncbi:cyanophycinase [Arcticibacter tournemirensis]|uniref:Cyanophycinase n=1 Tax=Arcticibacter tournemirensis TaxID=699437 RepID=A0A5M9HJJ5_9SPHI|nr:cyanophycinase [Arcticibacter tournemirensis]KAA8485611.1 cyanophycinase [Arcticibacter tournemirensis]TQM48671.1 cyanophycinase [Arcticibacter tournemirensis]